MKWGTRCWGVELPQVVWLPLLGPAFGGVWVFGFWFLVSPSFLFGWALGASHPFGGGLPGDVSEPIKKQGVSHRENDIYITHQGVSSCKQ